MELKPMLRWEIENLMRRCFPRDAESRADELWSLLVEAYGGPQRHYHNLVHIEEMVQFVLVRGPRLVESALSRATTWTRPVFDQGVIDKILFAVLFHDIVYDSAATKGSNEERSAVLAREKITAWIVADPDGRIGGNFARHFPSEVHDLILVTVDHDAKTPPEKLLCDADLARFADPWDRFVRHNDVDIRQEYDFVSDEDWLAGRKRVLTHYLMRDPMFYYATDLERQAVDNIVRALRLLEKG